MNGLITLKNIVAAALNGVCGNVFYYYPASWISVPCMAWRESGNREIARSDGGELLSEVTYTVDIWSNAPETNEELARDTDTRMADIGFVRTYSADVYEVSARLHHRVMRFRAVAGADGGIYQ